MCMQWTAGIPVANAPGVGGGRLMLPRPSTAFFGVFSELQGVPVFALYSPQPPFTPLSGRYADASRWAAIDPFKLNKRDNRSKLKYGNS